MHHRANPSSFATPTAALIVPFPPPFALSSVGTTEVAYFPICRVHQPISRRLESEVHRYGTDDR